MGTARSQTLIMVCSLQRVTSNSVYGDNFGLNLMVTPIVFLMGFIYLPCSESFRDFHCLQDQIQAL